MVLLLLTKRGRFLIIAPTAPRFFSASADLKISSFSIVDYLVSSFGFPPDKAVKVSKPIAHLKSSQKPDAVRRFLSRQGFTEADIKRLITCRPGLLYAIPENALSANLVALRGVGLSTSALNQIILSNPDLLRSHSAVPRVNFWKDFFGGDETALVNAFQKNRSLADHDIDRTISPNISLLHYNGFSAEYIRKIVLHVRRFITVRVSLAEDVLLRVKELGFHPGSGMFLVALDGLLFVTREELQRKYELLLGFGWSKDEFDHALQKSPNFLKATEKNLQVKMDFLTGEAGCHPSYISCRPEILTYSLEKRLRPRLHVLHLL